MIADLSQWMRQLQEAAESEPFNRVFLWRRVLAAIWTEGFQAGREAERRDREVVDRLIAAEQQAKGEGQ